METYLVSIDELRKKLGLKANRHKNAIISPDEYKFIEDDYSEVLTKIRSFEYLQYKDWSDLIGHMRDTQKLCKDAKSYSDLCKEITGERLTLVFKGQGKNKKKIPIDKLVETKKDTPDFVKAFNPCRAAGLKAAFRVGSLPVTEDDRRKMKLALQEWKAGYKGVGKTAIRLPIIEAWYIDVLGL